MAGHSGGARRVPGRGHEGDAGVSGRRREIGVEGRFAGELAAPPAHRHDGHARLTAGEVDGGQQVRAGIVVGLDQEDVGPRRDGVGPLDVERDLGGPAAVGGRRAAPAPLVDFGEGRVGQSELHVELVQVVGDVRVVEGVDDGDRLTATVADHAVEADVVEPIAVADLGGRVAARPGAAQRLDAVGGVERQVGRVEDRQQFARFERFQSEGVPPDRPSIPADGLGLMKATSKVLQRRTKHGTKT